jgi:bifunctional UDP-N-acetylglucosamine pyrophosphorylase/glucosamine-1-phosphate N-acetyltransferase
VKKKPSSAKKAGSRGRPGSRRQAEAAPRAIVLAAGVGSRMRSSQPKVLHRVAGRTLIEAVLSAAEGLVLSRLVVVVGTSRERVEQALAARPAGEGPAPVFRVQEAPLGTGDAARVGLEALGAGEGPILVLAGDTPLLRTATLQRLVETRRERQLDLAFLSFRPPEPADFGRVVRDSRGRVRRIVEAVNASVREKRIGEVNGGVYCFAPAALERGLSGLRRNPVSREYYLTDAVEALASSGARVEAVEAADWREAWGVNTRRDLAAAEELERRRGVERALDAGVTVLDPATVRVGPRVVLEPDVVLHSFVSLEGETALAEGSEILPFTRLRDCLVGPGASVGPHCEAEGARIGARARVGPFARLRPGTVIEEDVKVGNFVETKNTVLRRGAKAQHLSYLGDADIGAGSNIGAGVITCNYDGEKKHPTKVGERAFIGSDVQLVAPVTVGEGAYVGAGTTVTEDVPAGALALSRVPQSNRDGWVARRKEKKKTG